MRRSDDVQMNGAFVCSCTNDTSAIHGGRMSFRRGEWKRSYAANDIEESQASRGSK